MNLEEVLVEYYDKRFNEADIHELINEKILPRVANAYDKRFESWEILELINAGISPEFANKYGEKFIGPEVLRLFEVELFLRERLLRWGEINEEREKAFQRNKKFKDLSKDDEDKLNFYSNLKLFF